MEVYSKLDPNIQNLLNTQEYDCLTVFIHIFRKPKPEEIKDIPDYPKINTDRMVLISTLSVDSIVKLSNCSWVKYITMNKKLKPVSEEKPIGKIDPFDCTDELIELIQYLNECSDHYGEELIFSIHYRLTYKILIPDKYHNALIYFSKLTEAEQIKFIEDVINDK